jgi:hypothetical protein
MGLGIAIWITARGELPERLALMGFYRQGKAAFGRAHYQGAL